MVNFDDQTINPSNCCFANFNPMCLFMDINSSKDRIANINPVDTINSSKDRIRDFKPIH